MKARKRRSTAISASVTRSMAPFLSMRRPCLPNEAIWMRPASRTASMAVARKIGSGRAGGVAPGDSGTGRLGRREAFGHQDLHPAGGTPLQRDVVHEAAHEEDAAAARSQ